jgi:hypothetical protein
MKRTILTSTLSLLVLGITGCPAEENPDAEGCEHLQIGPAAAVTAVATGDGPAVAADHKRYDITLPASASQYVGNVSFAPDHAGLWILFLNSDAPVVVKNGAGTTLTPTATATSSTQCTEIKGRHTYDLAVGTNVITIGPTTATSVGMVIEHSHEAGGH